MKRMLSFLAYLLIVCIGFCCANNVTIIEINPCTASLPGVLLWSRKEKMVAGSLTLCFRYRINSWTFPLYLVESDMLALGLKPYDKNYFGVFQYFTSSKDVTFDLGPRKLVSFSTTSWNSMCLSFSALTMALTVIANGDIADTAFADGAVQTGNISLSKLRLGFGNDYSFAITELNIWSRALSLEEALRFTTTAVNDFAAKLKPDIFDWKDLAGVSFDAKCAQWRSIKADVLLMNAAKVKTHELISIKELNYTEASTTCQGLNGDLIDPSTMSNKSIIAVGVSVECSAYFWVPIPNVYSESSTMEGISESLYRQLSERETIRQGSICSCYDVSMDKKEMVGCDSRSVCTLCRIEHERLTFQIRFSDEELFRTDNGFFILQQKNQGQFLLTGRIKAAGSLIDSVI